MQSQRDRLSAGMIKGVQDAKTAVDLGESAVQNAVQKEEKHVLGGPAATGRGKGSRSRSALSAAKKQIQLATAYSLPNRLRAQVRTRG